jgi:Cu(I)/Ag(I) efflux system membrane protein CusA/SilA
VITVRARPPGARDVVVMINKLLEFSLRNRVLVIVVFLGLAGWGWWALRATPIDAIPDSLRQPGHRLHGMAGHSPQEVEDQVTYPLTVNLQGWRASGSCARSRRSASR